MSLGFVHFFQAAGAGEEDGMQEALLGQGLGLRLYSDTETLVYACLSHAEQGGPQLILLAGSPEQNCQLAGALRQAGVAAPIVSCLRALDNDVSLQAMRSGVDACWSTRLPVSLLQASVLRLMGRGAGERATGQPYGNGVPGWRLISRGWILQAPGGASVTLTSAERALLQALCQAPGHRASHAQLLGAIDAAANPAGHGPVGRVTGGQVYAGSAARRLSVLVSRLRRKCLAAGFGMPLRPLRRVGYELCVEFPAQALPEAWAGRTTTMLSRCMSSGSVM